MPEKEPEEEDDPEGLEGALEREPEVDQHEDPKQDPSEDPTENPMEDPTHSPVVAVEVSDRNPATGLGIMQTPASLPHAQVPVFQTIRTGPSIGSHGLEISDPTPPTKPPNEPPPSINKPDNEVIQRGRVRRGNRAERRLAVLVFGWVVSSACLFFLLMS